MAYGLLNHGSLGLNKIYIHTKYEQALEKINSFMSVTVVWELSVG